MIPLIFFTHTGACLVLPPDPNFLSISVKFHSNFIPSIKPLLLLEILQNCIPIFLINFFQNSFQTFLKFHFKLSSIFLIFLSNDMSLKYYQNFFKTLLTRIELRQIVFRFVKMSTNGNPDSGQYLP